MQHGWIGQIHQQPDHFVHHRLATIINVRPVGTTQGVLLDNGQQIIVDHIRNAHLTTHQEGILVVLQERLQLLQTRLVIVNIELILVGQLVVMAKIVQHGHHFTGKCVHIVLMIVNIRRCQGCVQLRRH